MLSETQEQLKKQRKKAVPTVRGGLLFPSMMSAPQPDSLAMELESSLYSESSLDSGIIADRMQVENIKSIHKLPKKIEKMHLKLCSRILLEILNFIIKFGSFFFMFCKD